jgi:hypothetical protein
MTKFKVGDIIQDKYSNNLGVIIKNFKDVIYTIYWIKKEILHHYGLREIEQNQNGTTDDYSEFTLNNFYDKIQNKDLLNV